MFVERNIRSAITAARTYPQSGSRFSPLLNIQQW